MKLFGQNIRGGGKHAETKLKRKSHAGRRGSSLARDDVKRGYAENQHGSANEEGRERSVDGKKRI